MGGLIFIFWFIFRTPPYKNTEIHQSKKVYVELERPTDGARSDPKEFTYTACDRVGAKRARASCSSTEYSGSNYGGSSDVPVFVNQSGSLDIISSSQLKEMVEKMGQQPVEFADSNEIFNLFSEIEGISRDGCDTNFKKDR